MELARTLTFNEKLAAVLFILFGPIHLIANSLTTSNLFGSLASLLFWLVAFFIAVCVALATVFLRPNSSGSYLRDWIGRILPLAVLLITAIGVNFIGQERTKRNMKSFANQNERLLSGTPPRSVIYVEGVPDGGIAIIRSPLRNPTGFTQSEMVELTGERIKSCDQLDARDWACRFD
tara:strand:+ start:140 stop:670 length:531 start_codon:yes stop_codon:yes gene_type:complete